MPRAFQVGSEHWELEGYRELHVPLLRGLWSLFDGIQGILKGSWGIVEEDRETGFTLVWVL